MKATVVTVRRANFARNECSGGLAAETAVKALEEARGRGYVRQGLLTWRRALSARRAEQNPRTRTPRLLLHSHSPQAQALVQGLEGDLLALDWVRRQFEEGGSWGRQGESAARRIEMRGCCGVRVDVGPFGLPCSVGNLARLTGVSDWGTAAARKAVWDVNVDEVLRVEGMNLALTGSHNGWGEDGEVRVLQRPLIGAKPLWAPIHLFSAVASRPALRLTHPTLRFRLRRSSTSSTVRDACSKLGTVVPMPRA
ncbi:hypothetical protein POSPLADRAFT_1138552 [Postia placenta MAD-698-R-SB12]|uniref:Uncharacterized protein n=1 Tax=Postia placenta MAD-698-R-SB12 TaxID=670580 RepID=A0A1X6N602_9APHY|nr:hypothetical protein POSPLADRAFT_1138552 [Postia placenta MAD-698-R-SB12]OSX63833.1 hypothetical protein POSPLADRAFT_1138552 [Postia placenta MAD-698-R-SB12]